MENLNNHPLAGKHDIDSAFSGIWSFYKQWFVPLYAISFIMALIASYISSGIDLGSIQNTMDINEIMAFMKSIFGIMAIQLVISLFFNLLLQYFIIYKPLKEDFNIMEAIGTVFVKFFFPILLISILLGVFAFFALMLGALLLFVGIFFAIPYIMLFYTLLSPLMIIEKTSITETVPRLFKLVHRKFWPNMGWISIFLVLLVFFTFIVNAIITLPFSGSMISSFTDPDSVTGTMKMASNPIFIIVSSLASALTGPLLPILGLVLYFNNSNDNTEFGTKSNNKNDDKVKVEDLYSKNTDNSTDDEDNFSPTVDDLKP